MRRSWLAVRHPIVLGLGVTLLCLSGSPADAAIIDLTTNSRVNAADAIYFQSSTHPAGTGVYDPFLRIQAKGIEEGFNTDAKSPSLDTKSGTWTHSLQIGDLDVVEFEGKQYFAFDLDINEPQGGNKNLLSLDKLQIYTFNGDGSINSLDTLETSPQSTLRYNLDGTEESTVYLDSNISGQGSGTDDMTVFIDATNFAGALDTDYLYLYSLFGATKGMGADEPTFDSAGGFEEWRARLSADGDDGGGSEPPPGPGEAPEPSTLVLLANGLLVGLVVRRRKRSSES